MVQQTRAHVLYPITRENFSPQITCKLTANQCTVICDFPRLFDSNMSQKAFDWLILNTIRGLFDGLL